MSPTPYPVYHHPGPTLYFEVHFGEQIPPAPTIRQIQIPTNLRQIRSNVISRPATQAPHSPTIRQIQIPSVRQIQIPAISFARSQWQSPRWFFADSKRNEVAHELQRPRPKKHLQDPSNPNLVATASMFWIFTSSNCFNSGMTSFLSSL